jgi:hypothetical protein
MSRSSGWDERSTATVTRRTAQHKGNGPRAALDPAAVAKGGSAERQSEGRIQGLIAKRAGAATEHALAGPNQKLLRAQKHVWVALCDYYFRLETSGWERLPQETSLLIGNHSGRGPDDGRLDARLRLVAAIRHRARASCDRSRCPDGRARPRRLLPPGRRDPSLPPRRQCGAQRRARRDHLAGGRGGRDAQLAQARSGRPRRAQGLRTPGDSLRRADRSRGQHRRP